MISVTRTALPGTTFLLASQLGLAFKQGFTASSQVTRYTHLVAIVLVAISAVIMAFPEQAPNARRLSGVGLLLLAAGIATDVGAVAWKLFTGPS